MSTPSMEFTFETDEELQQALGMIDSWVGTVRFPKRIFVEVPEEKFANCPESIGRPTKKMNDNSNNYIRLNGSDGKAYTVLGARSTGLKGQPTGTYDSNVSFTKEEVQTWITEFGVANMHVNYPKEVDEI